MWTYMYIKLHFALFSQEGELYRLEHQVQRLETENLRKDVKILQLEKQLQTALYSRTQVRWKWQGPRGVQVVVYSVP